MTITLKTLPQASAQDVFDQVARHLLTQKERSRRDQGICLYRGDGGLKCAAGCLIADDEYHPVMEYRSWETLRDSGDVPPQHVGLISSLQTLHDGDDPDGWKHQLRITAAAFDLSPAVVDEFEA